ncbi:MAG: DUF2958 domain-containing protein [Nanoarchaeota archaeon]|jgi:hypothetical protein|nr:DUF2958 domain-containing protein [Nanoarchaeota archaeon]
MKLLTKEIEKRFKKIGNQEKSTDLIVIAKFFNPTGIGTWYITELVEYRLKKEGEEEWECTESFDVKEKLVKEGYIVLDVILFGYASLFGDHNDEWGYISLKELEEFRGQFSLGIERDLHCGEKPISEFNIKSLKL